MHPVDDHEVLREYQNCHFKLRPEDPFSSSDLKRRCLFLAQLYSFKRHPNQASCKILEEHLNDYCVLIDDRNGINNFAEATLDLVSNIKSDSSSWSSTLSTNGPKLEELLLDIPGECGNPFDGGCGNLVPTEVELKKFFSVDSLKKKIDQPVKEENSVKHGIYKPAFVHKQPKLYSTYGEVPLRPNHKTFDINKDEIKTVDQRKFNHQRNSSIVRSSNSINNPIDEKKGDEELPRSGVYFSRVGGKSRKWGRENSNDSEESSLPRAEDTFKTANQQLRLENQRKFGNTNGRQGNSSSNNYQQTIKKSLGGKRPVGNKFVPPMKNGSQEDGRFNRNCNQVDNSQDDEEVDERLKNIDPKMIELIKNEIMDQGSKIGWDDIAGLHFAKSTIQEIVVWPMLRPDIFTGLRRPPKGILLFGPPGTGKTLIGKCIASQSNSTFFSISASSLTSKWIGDGEKMVRALFAVARVHQPSVVFIDEIDSLLSQRSDTEHESSRRIKTEFLVQLDGAATGDEDRILVIGATNRPQELDEAARRRLVKRLYIPLPDSEARIQLVSNLMKNENNCLTEENFNEVANLTDGYSGADVKNLCQEACLGPIRSIGPELMFNISAAEVRPVSIEDFKSALRRIRSSVSPKDLEQYIVWDRTYGCGGATI